MILHFNPTFSVVHWHLLGVYYNSSMHTVTVTIPAISFYTMSCLWPCICGHSYRLSLSKKLYIPYGFYYSNSSRTHFTKHFLLSQFHIFQPENNVMILLPLLVVDFFLFSPIARPTQAHYTKLTRASTVIKTYLSLGICILIPIVTSNISHTYRPSNLINIW